MVFMRAKKGCTELTFGAPSYFSEITVLLKHQISQLKDHDIIEVTINGRNLMQCKYHEGSGIVSLPDFFSVEFKIQLILETSVVPKEAKNDENCMYLTNPWPSQNQTFSRIPTSISLCLNINVFESDL